jgi:hypothetical protein
MDMQTTPAKALPTDETFMGGKKGCQEKEAHIMPHGIKERKL